jgi:hypothetical protein
VTEKVAQINSFRLRDGSTWNSNIFDLQSNILDKKCKGEITGMYLVDEGKRH